MTLENKEKILSFLQDQIAQAPFRTKAYVFNDEGKKNPTRNIFVKLKMYTSDFIKGKSEPRWLVMTGLRGAGKTTLLAQLYHAVNVPNDHKLFLSVDQITQTFGASLRDILEVYEELLGTVFERLEHPVFIFLDEAQYDKSWAALLKTVYDRSKKVFFVVTGSSALMLYSNPDVERRTIYEKLYPMSFTEYLKIKDNKFEKKGLSQRLKEAIFSSQSATEVYERLKEEEKIARSYWTGVDRLEVNKYIEYGTLPYMVALKNEALIYDQIKKTLDRVISVDMAQIGQFTPDVLSSVHMLLYAIADSDQLSVNSLTKSMQITRPTLINILDTLEKTETITRVYPYGSHAVQVRKPSKYLFASPAFRSMYFKFIGSIHNSVDIKGKLWEDVVGMYFTRILQGRKMAALTYDSSQGGADFILKFPSDCIVVEVGAGEKDFRQINKTMSYTKLKPRYGITISRSPLRLSEDGDKVSIPFSYFLLI